MLSDELNVRLVTAAELYECVDFIEHDPVKFPHKYTQKCDIEISGLLTALISFGNRKQILAKAGLLCDLMGKRPHSYVLSRRFADDFPRESTISFYRMMKYGDFRRVFDILYNVYSHFPDLEKYLLTLKGSPMERMCCLLGVASRSPQKKINMFLRWMIRRDSPVDFGIWRSFSPAELIVPLDTHVLQIAFDLGLIATKNYSLATAERITAAMREVFGDDPVKGDFALFGSGVNAVRTQERKCLK